jgi:hypothetical protein
VVKWTASSFGILFPPPKVSTFPKQPGGIILPSRQSAIISATWSNIFGRQAVLRVGRQVLLTSEGELFLPEAIAIVEKIENAKFKVKRHSEGKSGKISIGMVNTSYTVLSRCLSVFFPALPGYSGRCVL